MKSCKFCNAENIVKIGFTWNKKQKYKCKDCKRVGIEGDRRVKHTDEVRNLASIMYQNGVGFRRIAEILSLYLKTKIAYQSVVQWLSNQYRTMVKEEVKKPREYCDIIEFDELFTYVKKNLKKIQSPKNTTSHLPEYGLLLIGTQCVCVHFPLEMEVKKAQSN